MKKASNFSDLYPIKEEIKGTKSDLKPVPQVSVDIDKSKDDVIKKKIHKSVRKNRIGVSLLSTQKPRIDQTCASNCTKEVKKFIPNKSKDRNLETVKTDLDHKFMSLTVESKLPSKNVLTSKEERAVRNTFNRKATRKSTQPTSVRRNRKERMRSAHSQNRASATQVIPKTKAGIKQDFKQVPKICGNLETAKKSVDQDIGKDKIKEMLRKIDSLED